MKLNKYLHLSGIVLTGLMIIYYYTKSAVDNKLIYNVEKNISNLKEKESLINFDYFLIESHKVKHFDKIRNDFIILKNESDRLKELVAITNDTVLIENVNKYLGKLEKKEEIFNKLLSHTAVNHNLKNFFFKLIKDDSKIFESIDGTISFNILKIQILYSNNKNLEIEEILKDLKKASINLHFLDEQKINYLIEYTNVFIQNDSDLDRLERKFIRANLYSYLDSVLVSLNNYFHKTQEKSTYYNHLMLVMIASLFLWIFYFLRILNKANKKIEETLNELNFQKYALDEHAIVSIADIKGNIIYANEKFIDITQYAKEDLIGKNHRILKSDEHDKEFFKNMWKTISSGRIWHGEIKNKKRDGTFYWVESTIVPFLDKSGYPFQYISIRTDITVQKKIQKELTEAKDEADRLNSVKSQFLANMSHELRTPLNGILGLSKIVLDSEKNEKQRNYLEKIHISGNLLLKIINDLLDYSKIEAGKLSIEKSQFGLDSLLENISHLLSVKAYEKNLKLYFNKDMNIPNLLIGDSLRISQILMNIIGNSIKFTHKGYVQLEIKLNDIDEKNVYVNFIIKDTGIGMSDETLKNIFDSFSQADISTTRKYGGTGLGLSISKNLVELMDGKIEVNSKLNEGSEFSFMIPFEYKKEKELNSFDEITIYLYEVDTIDRLFIENIFNNKDIKYVVCKELPSILFENQILITEKMEGLLLENYKSVIYLCEIEDFDIDNNHIKLLHKPIIASSLINKLSEFIDVKTVVEKIDESKIFEKLNVLLVDDNDMNQLVGSSVLETFGCKVDLANNGELAIKMLNERPNYYNIVFMDVQMPIMNGYEATKIIRKDLSLTLPIIAMTANTMKEDIHNALECGMDSHIGKPINSEEIKNNIKKYCY